jgi:hypothetical protein
MKGRDNKGRKGRGREGRGGEGKEKERERIKGKVKGLQPPKFGPLSTPLSNRKLEYRLASPCRFLETYRI